MTLEQLHKLLIETAPEGWDELEFAERVAWTARHLAYSEHLRDISSQLSRYLGAPNKTLLAILNHLSDINDDLCHDRPIDKTRLRSLVDAL